MEKSRLSSLISDETITFLNQTVYLKMMNTFTAIFLKGGNFMSYIITNNNNDLIYLTQKLYPKNSHPYIPIPKYAKNNYFIFTIADEDHLHTLLKLHQASTNHIKLIYTPLVSQENLENNNPHLLFIYTK